jgi:sirohydrochlorin cobaltochelatase
MTPAILIAGHGSRDPDGIAEFLDLARHFKNYRPETPVEIAFLEFARPTIQEGIDRLVNEGAETIVVLPGVLMAAGHAKNDMASEVRRARERYPHLTIHMGRALDVEPRLLQLSRIRYLEAVNQVPSSKNQEPNSKNQGTREFLEFGSSNLVLPEETLLLLVGRGSSDPDANANIAKVARFLQEGYATGWACCAFSGIARPLLEEAFPICERMGFRRIVVQPYFLFTGILLKRIYAYVEERRRARPDLEILATPHLQAHPLLIETFAERAEEALHGDGHMNCSLCQYRVPIIGHEHHVGEPQQPHHHHVQGMHEHVHYLEESVISGQRSEAMEKNEEQAKDFHSWSQELVEQLGF